MRKFIEKIAIKSYRMMTYSYEYPKLGRWKIDHNTTIIHYKIDQANDHSGWCAQKIENIKSEEYMIPYCM